MNTALKLVSPCDPPHPNDLRDALERVGVTHFEVARVIGVSRKSVYRWIAGERLPDRDHIAALFAFLRRVGIDPSAVWEPRELPHLLARFAPIGTPPPSAPSNTPQEDPMEIMSRDYLDDATLRHFGLEDDPFSEADSPDDVWMSPIHRQIESLFGKAVQRHQIVALTGEPGSGKSTLLRRFFARCAGTQKVKVLAPASLNRAKVTSTTLAVAILRDLVGKDTGTWSMEARSELLRVTLEDQTTQGVHPVLLIDEAHLLPTAGLIGIKQIWDSHTLFRQLAVILVGQPMLRERLTREVALREVTGRTLLLAVPKLTEIARLVPGQTATDFAAEYVRWRFARVNGDANAAFTTDALKALGVRGEYPLWLNNIAVKAMLYAASVGDAQVTAAHVGRV